MTTVQSASILAGAVYGASLDEMFAPAKGRRNVSRARAYAFRLCRDDGMTFAQIAREFRLDEKSIRQAIKKDKANA